MLRAHGDVNSIGHKKQMIKRIGNKVGPVALTSSGFQIILYHRYDSCNYVRVGWVRFGLFSCVKIRWDLNNWAIKLLLL